MSTAAGLAGVGVPGEVGIRTGVQIREVTTSASPTQLKGPGNLAVLVTVAVAAQEVRLPDNADLGDEVEVYSQTALALNIVPHLGGTINNGGANSPLVVTAAAPSAANSGVRFRKMSATNWRTMGSFS